MSINIKCPNCQHEYPLEDVMAEDYKKELREKALAYNKKKEREFNEKLAFLEKEKEEQQKHYQQQLQAEKNKLKADLEENLRKSIAGDYETRLHLAENAAKDNEEKLKLARQKELELMRMQQELKTREEEMEIRLQRQLQEQREQWAEQIRKQEAEKNNLKDTEYQLKLRELEKQLDDQKKLAEEMRRKAEQGSMQLQGEVQELILEELLRNNFPFDMIEEVGKGVRGADCVQIVRNQFGQECGKIIYESKRTKEFSKEWIEKLKKDMRSMGIDVAVIVSQCYPKGMDCFGQMDGIWICSFEEVNAVAFVLREGILKLSQAVRSQENKGDKMHMLYDYLTSAEFGEQWKAIREGFMSMKLSIQKERDAMERLWKAREKQLEKVLLNASHIRGSIEGIAGNENIQLSLSDDEDNMLPD